MHFQIKQLIEQIHQSPLYGSFIETGGPCIAAELMKVSGASKTIRDVSIPYAKEASDFYKSQSCRTVSKEYIKDVLEYCNNERILTYVSSFQLNGNCHGYVGINKNNNN